MSALGALAPVSSPVDANGAGVSGRCPNFL
jgi:hypothetical protein